MLKALCNPLTDVRLWKLPTMQSSPSQDFPFVLWSPKAYCRVRSSSPLDPILSQVNTVHSLVSCFFETNFILAICSISQDVYKSSTKTYSQFFVKHHSVERANEDNQFHGIEQFVDILCLVDPLLLLNLIFLISKPRLHFHDDFLSQTRINFLSLRTYYMEYPAHIDQGF